MCVKGRKCKEKEKKKGRTSCMGIAQMTNFFL